MPTRCIERYCRFCGECEGRCPNGVAIADVNRYAMYFKYYGREKDSMRLYEALGDGGGGGGLRGLRGPLRRRLSVQADGARELVDAHSLLSFRGS